MAIGGNRKKNPLKVGNTAIEKQVEEKIANHPYKSKCLQI